MTKRAFTLIEMLVVTAVIAVIAGLLVPVLASAKKAGKRATTISNLRQCGMALHIYQSDNDSTTLLPNYDTAKGLLAGAPTCDLNDSWRASCKEDFGKPLIGSYAYIRGTQGFESEDGFRNLAGAVSPMMISIFYASPQLPRFAGDAPSMSLCATNSESCYMPTDLIMLRPDGSVYLRKAFSRPDGTPPMYFSWTAAFFNDENTEWVKF